MAVKTIRYEDMALEDPVAVIGFPSVGLVSSITANYMVGQLDMTPIAGLSSPSMPPYCLIYKGVAYPPVRFYGRKHTTKTGRDLIVCLSEYAPKPEDCYELVQAILSYLKYMGCHDIISLEGTARVNDTDGPVVCGVGPGAAKMAKKSKLREGDVDRAKGATSRRHKANAKLAGRGDGATDALGDVVAVVEQGFVEVAGDEAVHVASRSWGSSRQL